MKAIVWVPLVVVSVGVGVVTSMLGDARPHSDNRFQTVFRQPVNQLLGRQMSANFTEKYFKGGGGVLVLAGTCAECNKVSSLPWTENESDLSVVYIFADGLPKRVDKVANNTFVISDKDLKVFTPDEWDLSPVILRVDPDGKISKAVAFGVGSNVLPPTTTTSCVRLLESA